MSKKKTIMTFGISSLLMTGLLSAPVFASWTNTTVSGIPGGGGSATNFDTPNVKDTYTMTASFAATYISASFGLKGQICNSNAVDKSYQATLVTGSTVSATEINSPQPGYYYYPKGVSMGFEYSGGQLWAGSFSAN